jgi:tetratricopeptide (TPR) repeat protein
LSTTTKFDLEPPAEIAEAVEKVLDQILEARELERNGCSEESLALACEARKVADLLPYAPVQAEAIVQVARALDGRQDASAGREAESLYFDALDIAEGERRDGLAAMIWIRLVQLAIQIDCDARRAFAWWRRASAAVRRIGNPPCELARVHYLRSEIHYREGSYLEAEHSARQAIAAISGHCEIEQRHLQHELSRYHGVLAKSLEPQNRLDEALGLHVVALNIAREALGSSHPDVIKLQMNYGLALKKSGQLKRAREELEAAQARMVPKRCASCFDAGILQSYLSDVHYEDDRLDVATTCGRKSLEIHEAAGAPSHRRAEACTSIANAELKRRNFKAALEMYYQARALRVASLGSMHYQVGVNEGSIAEALCGMGRYSDAMTHLGEAERVLAQSGAHDPQVTAWLLAVRADIVGHHRPGGDLPPRGNESNDSSRAHS